MWEAPVAGKNLFIPHKAILNAANTVLYVADRENRRVLSFATSEGGHGQVLSDNAQLGGTPYAISFNSSAASDWPMYGVIGGVNEDRLMGFTLDAGGERIDTWGPQEVCHSVLAYRGSIIRTDGWFKGCMCVRARL